MAAVNPAGFITPNLRGLDGINYRGHPRLDCADSVHDFFRGYRNGITTEPQKTQITNALLAHIKKAGGIVGADYITSLGFNTLAAASPLKALGYIDSEDSSNKSHPSGSFETDVFNALLSIANDGKPLNIVPVPVEKVQTIGSASTASVDCLVIEIDKKRISSMGEVDKSKMQAKLLEFLLGVPIDTSTVVHFAFDASAATVAALMDGREASYNLVTPQSIADPASSTSKLSGETVYYFPTDSGSDNFTALQNSFTRGAYTIIYVDNGFTQSSKYNFTQKITNVGGAEIASIKYGPTGAKRSGPSVNELLNIMLNGVTTRIDISDIRHLRDKDGALAFDLKRLGDHEQVRAAINFNRQKNNVVFVTQDKVCSIYAINNGLPTIVQSSKFLYFFKKRTVVDETPLDPEAIKELIKEKEELMNKSFVEKYRTFFMDVQDNTRLELLKKLLAESIALSPDSIPSTLYAKYKTHFDTYIALKKDDLLSIKEGLFSIFDDILSKLTQQRVASIKSYIESDNSNDEGVAYKTIMSELNKSEYAPYFTYFIQSYIKIKTMIDEGTISPKDIQADIYRFDMMPIVNAFSDLFNNGVEVSEMTQPLKPENKFPRMKDKILTKIYDIGKIEEALIHKKELFAKLGGAYSTLLNCIKMIPYRGDAVPLSTQLLELHRRFMALDFTGCPAIANQSGGYRQIGGDDSENEPRLMNATDITFIRELCDMADEYLTPLITSIFPYLTKYVLITSINKAKKARVINTSHIQILNDQLSNIDTSEIDDKIHKELSAQQQILFETILNYWVTNKFPENIKKSLLAVSASALFDVLNTNPIPQQLAFIVEGGGFTQELGSQLVSELSITDPNFIMALVKSFLTPLAQPTQAELRGAIVKNKKLPPELINALVEHFFTNITPELLNILIPALIRKAIHKQTIELPLIQSIDSNKLDTVPEFAKLKTQLYTEYIIAKAYYVEEKIDTKGLFEKVSVDALKQIYNQTITTKIGGIHIIDYITSLLSVPDVSRDIIELVAEINTKWNEYSTIDGKTPYLKGYDAALFSQLFTEGARNPAQLIITLSLTSKILHRSWNNSIYPVLGIINTGRYNIDLLNTGSMNSLQIIVKTINEGVKSKEVPIQTLILARGGARRTHRRRTIKRKGRKVRKTRHRR